jgi:hypothetical protein
MPTSIKLVNKAEKVVYDVEMASASDLNQLEMPMGYSGVKNLARGSQRGVSFANATTFST